MSKHEDRRSAKPDGSTTDTSCPEAVMKVPSKRGRRPGFKVSAGGKRTALTLNQKVAAIRFREKHPECKLADVGDFIKKTFDLEVSQAALSMLMKKKDALKKRHAEGNSFTNAQTRQRASPVESLNQALAFWCHEQISLAPTAGPLTDTAIKQKAREMSIQISDFPRDPKQFNFSNSWLYKFKKRNGILQELSHVSRQTRNEADADQAGMLLAALSGAPANNNNTSTREIASMPYPAAAAVASGRSRSPSPGRWDPHVRMSLPHVPQAFSVPPSHRSMMAHQHFSAAMMGPPSYDNTTGRSTGVFNHAGYYSSFNEEPFMFNWRHGR